MPKFARKDVQINPQGGLVQVQVICGFAHHIRFVAELFDSQGNNPDQPPHIGSSEATDPPPFNLSRAASDLVGRFLMITADVFHMGISDNFKVEVVLRQDGKELDRIPLADTFKDNVALRTVTRFQ